MKVERVVVGNLEENCYIIRKDGHCLIVDPGDDFSKIRNSVGEDIVDGILVTHHHFDHDGALKEALDYYKVKLYDFLNTSEGECIIGVFKLEVIYNPGHSRDSISFYFNDANMMFVGDFVFRNNIGRCDLEGGSFRSMMRSIDKLKTRFSSDVVLYPGHGDETTLEYEKENNSYFIQV